MQQRLSKRFLITLPPQLEYKLKAYQAEYGWKRSVIIQQALWDWFDKQGSSPSAQQDIIDNQPMLVGGKLYRNDATITDYLEPGMDAETHVRILQEFEAAERHRYTKD